jgi:hypothetical protein
MILVRHLINDPEWGEVKVYRPTPRKGDPWGDLSVLKETTWGQFIYPVTGEAFSHALHGWATPLMRELGPQPLKVVSQIPPEDGICEHYDDCIIARHDCIPSGPPPECYEAPLKGLAGDAANEVMVAWRDGWVVVVTDGEFSLS